MSVSAVVSIGSARLEGRTGAADETPLRFDQVARVAEWELRERFLYDEVRIRIGAFEFTRAGTPLLDFCMSLQFALRGLAVDGKSSLGFPDGATRIRFGLTEETVRVRSTTQPDGSGECTYIQLASAVYIFQRSALDAVTRDHPELLLNDLVERLFREYGARELGAEQFARHTEAVRRRHGG